MNSIVKPISVQFSADKELYNELKRIIGRYPNNIELYKIALTQRSQMSTTSPTLVGQKTKNAKLKFERCPHNERLEFLGDAVLGTIVAETLYKMFPDKREGFLTKMRAKIVSRKSLNLISRQSGLNKLIDMGDAKHRSCKNAFGNVLEAIHGALLLDFGYETTREIFISKFLSFIDVKELIEEEVDYKSRILEWGQKNKKNLTFEEFEEGAPQDENHFRVILFDGETVIGEGFGSSKKEASQRAARKAWESGKID